MSESNPLVERVDALLKRHQQQQDASPASLPEAAVPAEPIPAEDDVPVLTEVVDAPTAPAGADAQGRLAEGIEAAVLERVLEELDQSLQMRLNRTISEVVDQALDGIRVDLADRVRRLVREAVAAALAKQGIEPKRFR